MPRRLANPNSSANQRWMPTDKTMTVLHLICSEGLYGAENMLVLLARKLKHRGWRAIIGAFRDSRDPHTEVVDLARAHGLETEIIPCRGRIDPRAVRFIRKIVAAQEVDVLHAHGYKTNLYGYAAVRWRTRRTSSRTAALVSTCHAWQGQHQRRMRIYAAIDRFMLQRFDRVAVVSEPLVQLLRSSGIEAARVRPIANAIEVERTVEAQPVLRAELGGINGPLVAMVARLAPEKGGDVLLQAVPQVLSEFPETTFAFVGEGPSRASWELLAAQLGINKRVVFTGGRRDMPEVYASLDLLVLPSFNEGMPMCLLEAMAAARPVVATPVGSVEKLVLPERTGWLVRPGNAQQLAKAIQAVLRNPALARRIGESARAHVRANFAPEAMTNQYIQLYEEALELRANRQ